MTDSFTAEMGSVQSLHTHDSTTKQTADPSSSWVAYWDGLGPKLQHTGQATALGMLMELLPLPWSAASRFGDSSLSQPRGWRQEQHAPSARARVSSEGAGENTALCHQPL